MVNFVTGQSILVGDSEWSGSELHNMTDSYYIAFGPLKSICEINFLLVYNDRWFWLEA